MSSDKVHPIPLFYNPYTPAMTEVFGSHIIIISTYVKLVCVIWICLKSITRTPALSVFRQIRFSDIHTVLHFQGKILETCETWYEWMVGKLLYTNPSVKIFDLSHFAEEAISRFGGLSSMTTLDSVILAAMELDIPQVKYSRCPKFGCLGIRSSDQKD